MKTIGLFCWAAVCVALMVLTGFLCYTFQSGWAALILLLLPSYKVSDNGEGEGKPTPRPAKGGLN